jgi:hypothetical protein
MNAPLSYYYRLFSKQVLTLQPYFARFNNIIAALIKTQVIWDITLCWLVNSYQCFDNRGAFIFRVKQPIDKDIKHFRNLSNYIYQVEGVVFGPSG